MKPKLRIALTLSGAVSLGAYEAGALAAFLIAVQSLDGEVVVDAIGGASAGSITGLLTARSLLRGSDPVKLMTRAWVELDDIDEMLGHDMESPLSSVILSKIATSLLGPPPDGIADGAYRQSEPIHLSFALANLQGLAYRIPSLERSTPIEAATYIDWVNFTLDETNAPQTYVEKAEEALASAANAMGFPPKRLDRSTDRKNYEDAGITNFPKSGAFWYTDGGTIDNEPLGRTIGLTATTGGDGRRLYLLVVPHPTLPPANGRWSDPDHQPSWTRTALRTAGIAQTQSIYDDLRQLEKVNSQLAWADELTSAVDRFLDGLPATSRDEVRAAFTTEIRNSLEKVTSQHNRLREQQGRAATSYDFPDDAPAAFRKLLNKVGDIEGKRPAKVEVVSPEIGAKPGTAVEERLAGEFLFHFGGFFEASLRQSDFALGWSNMTDWMAGAFPEYLDAARVRAAVKVAGAAMMELGWADIRRGDASLGKLPLGEQWDFAKLIMHIGHIVERDLRHFDDA